MQFTIFVNQSKALEWGLNAQQALLFSFVYETPSWAKTSVQEDGVYFVLSKAKIVQELPLLTDKPDTAYRLLKSLQDKGVIDLSSTNLITLVRITEKGKTWNKKEDGTDKYPGNDFGSEKNPIRVGKKSEAGSEKSPTNQVTSNQDTNHKTPLASGDAKPKKKHQIPEGFEPNETNRRIADEHGVVLDNELDNFKDYHGAKGSTFKDWNLALNTWIRNAGKRKSNVHQFPGKPQAKYHDLSASAEGLTPRADGTYSL